MARARNIKPAFFDNEELAEIDFAGRLLFIGLWTLSDRNGILEDRPKRIKARLFPYDDLDVNGYLTVLERLNFVQRYSIENKHYILIKNFSKHQRPHHTEKESGLPLLTLESLVTADNGESTLDNGDSPLRNVPLTDTLTTDSLIPDSLNIDSAQKKVLSKKSVKKENLYSEDFEEFWKIYPRKIGKFKSAQSYQKAIKEGVSHEAIKSTAGQFARSCIGKESEFIKHPTTWFNGKHWEDDHTTDLARPKSRIDTICEEITAKRNAEWAAREKQQSKSGAIDGNAQTMLEHSKEVRAGGKQLH